MAKSLPFIHCAINPRIWHEVEPVIRAALDDTRERNGDDVMQMAIYAWDQDDFDFHVPWPGAIHLHLHRYVHQDNQEDNMDEPDSIDEEVRNLRSFLRKVWPDDICFDPDDEQ